MNEQRKIERQVAAMHRAIAERLRGGDTMPLGRARSNLARWEASFGGALPAAYAEWVMLIDTGLEAVLHVLETETEDAVRLRSSSPFTGVLTPHERWRILRDAA